MDALDDLAYCMHDPFFSYIHADFLAQLFCVYTKDKGWTCMSSLTAGLLYALIPAVHTPPRLDLPALSYT